MLIGRGVIKAGRGSAILKKIGLSGLKKDKSKISRSQIIKAAKKAKKTEDRVPATKSAFVPATEHKKFKGITKDVPGMMKDLPLIKAMSREQRRIITRDEKLLNTKPNRKFKRIQNNRQRSVRCRAVTEQLLRIKKERIKKVKSKAQGGSIKSFSANLKRAHLEE